MTGVVKILQSMRARAGWRNGAVILDRWRGARRIVRLAQRTAIKYGGICWYSIVAERLPHNARDGDARSAYA